MLTTGTPLQQISVISGNRDGIFSLSTSGVIEEVLRFPVPGSKMFKNDLGPKGFRDLGT
jgi:hypothetical protein